MNKQFLFMLVTVASILVSCSKQQADYSLIPVKSGESWGYINPKGEYVINPQFADADFFRDGLAYVKSSDGKVGYIGTDGKYAIAAEYKEGTPFSEGLAFVVAYGGAPVCIDKSGNKKFELQQAKTVLWFTEGLAAFTTADGKYGFVDKSGKVVINPQFNSAYPFSEGLALVTQDGKDGYIDKTGKIVINYQFESASSFHEGKANFKNGKKYGYIDKKGNYVINPQFDYANLFTDGLALVKSGDKWGYIAENGEIVINPQFASAEFFQNGLAPFIQNGSFGFIDKKGKIVINPQFDATSVFYGNMAFVNSRKQWGIIDKNGKYTVNPQFDDMKIYNIYYDLKLSYYQVTSDFYDTSEFIGKLFERAKGGSFDGFNAGSTLQNLLDNATYGNDVNANQEYAAVYNKSQKLTDEITIHTTVFNFYTPVFNGSYYNREYNFSAGMNKIQYVFGLSGDARQKSSAIAIALKSEFENRYKVQFAELPGGDGKIFASTCNEANKICCVVYFNDNTVVFNVMFPKDNESTIADNQLFLGKNKSKKGIITTESGLQYEVLKEGKGAKPTATDKVKVHYTGTLIDGKEFDSSVTRGEPLVFLLTQVIKGWTEGLQLMSVGSKYRLYLPYDLAYGENGRGNDIPAYATLIFDVELLEINPAE